MRRLAKEVDEARGRDGSVGFGALGRGRGGRVVVRGGGGGEVTLHATTKGEGARGW